MGTLLPRTLSSRNWKEGKDFFVKMDASWLTRGAYLDYFLIMLDFSNSAIDAH